MHKKRIFKFFKATLCAALALSMVFGDLGSTLGISYAKQEVKQADKGQVEMDAKEQEMDVTEEEIAASNGLATSTKDGVILHAFCWSFKTIKANMADIAAAGYTTVQTSPANACNDSHPQMKLYDPNQGTDYDGSNGCWWWHYQPTDWTIGNYQLGSAEDYKAMCDEADKYGIKIITDVIPNHTTPDLARVAQGLKNCASGSLYHENGKMGTPNISNWGNRLECTTGKMGGLPDVNTEDEGFQAYYLKYCNDLIDLGCDGFRYDTAKHIGVHKDESWGLDSTNTRGTNDFWDVATGKKSVKGVSLKNTDQIFIYGEVLQGDNVPTEEYANYMYQTASDYGGTLRDAIKNKNFSTGKISNWSHSNPEKVVSWVESHDTYCNGHESGWMTDWQIRMAWAIIAARKDGVPLWMSRPDGSNGSQGNWWGNNVLGAKGDDMYKDPEVAAVNFFRNAMAGEGETLRNPNGNQQILQIDRGTKGTCIINLGGETQINNETSLANGTYTDQVSGREFAVSGGKISGKLDGGKIAVIYNAGPITKDPSVNVSLADKSSFSTDTKEITLTATNATSAAYKIDDGEAVSFKGSKKITIGEGVDFGSTIKLTVTAQGEEGTTPFTKTYTYTKKEGPSYAKNTIYAKKPSGWGTLNIYAYVDGTTATQITGKWPGTAMTDAGDGVYTYTFEDSVSAAKVIFTDGTNQDPKDTPGQSCGYDYASGKAYTYEGGTWTPVDIKTATNTPKPTNTVTPKPTDTSTPTPTNGGKNTVTPTIAGKISVDFADGSSFATETKTVKITAANNAQGTYCVDDGPVKKFTGTANVVIGKGKIADTKVTLKVTVGDESKTFTYNKEFVADVKTAATNSTTDVKEAQVNASNSELASQYAINAKGVGAKKTITVDKSISDWDSSMLIAQGAANDDPRVYRPNSMYEVGIDTYALYGAYDDDNLYLMWEMTNVQDVVAPDDDFPLTQGTMYLNMNIPFFIAINTGKSDAIGNKGKTQTGGTIWDSGITFENSFNRLIAISTNGANGPYVYGGDSTGLNPTELYSKAGGGKANAGKSGIQFGYGMEIVSKTVMGIDGAYGAKNKRVVGDVCNNSAAWVDFNQKGHDSSKMDYHYEIAIPLEELGITASDVEANGVGVLLVATSGKSGMDCLPYDVSMNDQADLDDTAGSQENNSFEKSDEDHITTAFAKIGMAGPMPTATTPTKTPATIGPTATTEPTKTVTSTVTPTAKPDPTVPAGEMTVNFGADRSAPQYDSTKLTLEAKVNSSEKITDYEFFVDGASVQKGAESKYTWSGATSGAHVIKVVVTDAKGKTKEVSKDYDIETKGGSATATPSITIAPATSTPTPTPGASKLSMEPLKVTCLTVDDNINVGDSFTMSTKAKNAVGTPKYMFTYILNGEEVIVQNYSEKNEVTFVIEEEGVYRFRGYVVDDTNDGLVTMETGEAVVNAVEPTVTKGPDVTVPADASPTPTPEVTEKPVITGYEPTLTATPTQKPTATPTKKPVATATKKPVATATKKPVATPTKKPVTTPTKKPGYVTVTSIPKVTATATPTPKITKPIDDEGEIAPTLPANQQPKKGQLVGDTKTKSKYKVTSLGKTKEVQYAGYAGNSSVVSVPSTIKLGKVTYNVTSISTEAFAENSKITTLVIGKNVKVIGSYAFAKCTRLKNVKIGSNVTTIGTGAFYGCKKLSKVVMGSKVQKINSIAFYGCKRLKSIIIPKTVSRIGSKAFYNCTNLKSITIKTTKLKTSNVGSNAFKNTYKKATVKVPSKQLSRYKSLLKKKGLNSKAQVKKSVLSAL